MEVSSQLHSTVTLHPEKATTTHWVGGWVGPRINLDLATEGNIPFSAGNRNQVTNIIASHFTDSALMTNISNLSQ